MDPEFTAVAASLTELAARNTAAAVRTRIKAAKAAKQNEATINELVEIINQLLEDRGELLTVAKALEESLVAQQVSPEEIAYITDTLIPAAERLMSASGQSDNEAIAALKALVSVETLTVLQLVGFNFKAAIGAPLTTVVESLILNLAPKAGGGAQRRNPSQKR